MPKNSGPSSLAAEVKVLSSVDSDSVMKMILVMEKVAVPKNLETAVGLPASMLAKMACGTLRCKLHIEHGTASIVQDASLVFLAVHGL